MTLARIGPPIHLKHGLGFDADGTAGSIGEDVDLSAPYVDWINSLNNGPLFPLPAPSTRSVAAAAPACILDGFTSGLAVTNTDTLDISIGADAMNVPEAQSLYAVNGAGITIGILSDSFNVLGGMSTDIAAGLLPPANEIDILEEGPDGSEDEGRAMAELVHAVAPGAAIDFYTAFESEQDFANGILALAQAGCSIIVDDVTYFDEPFFQVGGTIGGAVIASAVEAVIAEGVSYFTAASNEGENFYQASFTPTSARLPNGTLERHVEEFSNGAVVQTIALSGEPVIFDLQWDQPFSASTEDNTLTMELFNSSNSLVAESSAVGAGEPVQLMEPTSFGSGTYTLAIFWNGQGTEPGLFKYIIYSGYEGADTIEAPAGGVGSGSVIGHEMVPGANTVGAVDASDVAFNNNGTETAPTESYSSVGPGEILFDANGNRLAEPIDPDKINFTAPDGIPTSVFNPFYGTSAAAPNAAAVAALMLQANPNLTPTQVTDDLASTAAVMNGGSTADGAGFVQAPGAVAAALGAVWTSATGGIWNTNTNWASGQPTTSTPATLSDDFGTLTASYVVLVTTTSAAADTLTIGDTSEITVNLFVSAGSTLSIATGATVGQDGSLTVAGTGSLAVGGIAELTAASASLTLETGAGMSANVLEIGAGSLALGTGATIETTGTIPLVLTFGSTDESVPFGLATGGGALDVGGALTVSAGGMLLAGASVTVESSVTIETGGVLADQGGPSALAIVLDTTVTDQGTFSADGGMLINTGANVTVAAGGLLSASSIDVEGTAATLDITGHVTDSGDLTGAAPGSVGVEGGGTLTVGGSLVGVGIDLSGGGLIDLTTTSSATLLGGFTSVITLANQSGGEIDLADVPYNGGADTLGPLNNGTLAIADAGTTLADLVFPAAANYQFTRADAAGALQIGVACYCRGTRIATPAGEKPIEELNVGDLVLTASNEVRPIRWIGRRTYGAGQIEKHRHLRPIRIRAGALGSGAPSTSRDGPIPARDLLVSPEHAIALPDEAGAFVLAPAHLLVNGVSIAREPVTAPVEYLHLELREHDIILAEGAAAESFVDDNSRALFDNAAEFRTLYPKETPRPATFCAPRVTGGPVLAAARTRFDQLAGIEYGPLSGFLDRADREMVAGWAHDPANPDCPVVIEIVVNGRVVDTVVADTFRADLARLGMAGGHCAFNWQWPRPLDRARRHIVSVRRAGDGAEMPGSPFLLDRHVTMETALADLRFAPPEVRRAMAEFLADQADSLEFADYLNTSVSASIFAGSRSMPIPGNRAAPVCPFTGFSGCARKCW